MATTSTSQAATTRILSFVGVIGFIVCGLFLYKHTQETHRKNGAAQALSDQGIELSADSFIKEVRAGHAQNVQNFITIDMNAGTENSEGTSALSAAAASPDDTITALVISTLPQDGNAMAIVNKQDAEGKTPLITAVEHNNATMVHQLIAHGADTGIADSNQKMALHHAIAHKFSGLIPVLLDADQRQHAPPMTLESSDRKGDTPLIYAIDSDVPESVKALIDKKADVNLQDSRGATPLMESAEVGNPAVGALLAAAGAKTNVADHFGDTPLILAIRHAHPAFARLLIDKGADPNFHTKEVTALETVANTTPFDTGLFSYLLAHGKTGGGPVSKELLFAVVDRKDPEMVKMLLARGYDPKAVNARGETLLYHLLESGLEDSALEVMDKGVDVTGTGVTGITPLISAATHNEPRAVKKLLSLGLSPNQKIPGSYTLAEMAVYKGYPDVLEALLQKGAQIEPDFGILWSIREGGGKAVRVLLDHGGHPTVMSNDGSPALWLAAASCQVDAVKAFIAHKAPLDISNQAQQMTALAVASHNGQLVCVKLLMDAGAKINATDMYGMTPLAHAAYMSKPDVVEYLMSKGADVQTKDSQGRTILDIVGIATPSPDRDKVATLLQRR